MEREKTPEIPPVHLYFLNAPKFFITSLENAPWRSTLVEEGFRFNHGWISERINILKMKWIIESST